MEAARRVENRAIDKHDWTGRRVYGESGPGLKERRNGFAAANLAFNAWLQNGMKFQLYFCETPGGTEMQPQQFIPNRRVDVESVADLKRESFLANAFIKHSWPETDLWAKFRGMEYGCKYAEAFVHMATVATMPPENIYPKRWYYGGLRLGHDY